MPSPIRESDITVLSAVSSVCSRLQALLDLPAQFKSFLSWILDDDGNLSDETVTGISDRLSPIGMIVAYGSSSLPSENWLVCAGQAVSRTTYATLFLRYGTTWGAGDGTNTFNIPDFRDRAIVGASTTKIAGWTGGAASVTSDVPAHRHYYGALAVANDDVNLFTDTVNSAGPATNAIQVAGEDSSGSPHSAFMSTISEQSLFTHDPIDGSEFTIATLPPSAAAHWIIKVL